MFNFYLGVPPRLIAKRWRSCFQDNDINKKMRIWGRVTGTVLIIINILYFLPLTVQILKAGGGPFGYGFLVLPITIVAHLFLIPSIMTWTRKSGNHGRLLIVNSIGLTWSIFWFTFFSVIPKV
jgi:hypothetical protein